ncbi:MAG: hypothetical protein MI923_26750, partial [Phycisphaerales bacterium]|nr:hypothetical protein [Phycisphaerales bacterium]
MAPEWSHKNQNSSYRGRPYVLHKPSLLLTVRMLSTYGACISLLHQGTMRYGSFDPYGPKAYGACISL